MKEGNGVFVPGLLRSIPSEILIAELTLSRWFEEKGITEWQLNHTRSRNIGKCEWICDNDEGIHDTGCNNAHCFEAGGIEENKYAYCPYCGKQIVETKIPDDEEDENA